MLLHERAQMLTQPTRTEARAVAWPGPGPGPVPGPGPGPGPRPKDPVQARARGALRWTVKCELHVNCVAFDSTFTSTKNTK